MQITKIENSYSINNQAKNKQAFCGVKDGERFREIATGLIEEFKQLPMNKYEATLTRRTKSPRQRLLNAIYTKASKIGEKHVTDEDRKLHEQLKGIYKTFQERDDYMDAMAGGGGHFIDQAIDFSI